MIKKKGEQRGKEFASNKLLQKDTGLLLTAILITLEEIRDKK